MSKLHVVVIHGIGDQKEGFSKSFRRDLRSTLVAKLVEKGAIDRGADPEALVTLVEGYWADIAKAAEQDMRKRFKEEGVPVGPGLFSPISHWVRNQTVSNFSDTFMYLTSDDVRTKIQQRIRETLASLLDRAAHPEGDIYVSIVAHSLGSVIVYELLDELMHERYRDKSTDYGKEESTIWDRIRLSNLFTLGSPLALFTIGDETGRIRTECHELHGKLRLGNQELYRVMPPFYYRKGGVWQNYYDKQDYISFPFLPMVKGLENLDGRGPFVVDINVNNSRTPFPKWSHDYFRNKKEVVSRIAEILADDYESAAIADSRVKHTGT